MVLSNFGITMLLSEPVIEPHGATASVNAGSLLIFWKPPNSSNLFTVSLGGARVSVASTPGFEVVEIADALSDVTPLPGEGVFGESLASFPALAPAAPSLDSGAVPVSSTNAPITFQPAATFSGIALGWALLALALVALLGTGAFRLGSSVLDRTGVGCTGGGR
jgi:hypothetical protein